jgi:hypothetical protein
MREGNFMNNRLINTCISLALLIGLAGCGAGGGGGTTPVVPTEPVVPTSTLIKGLYSGTLGSKEVISVVTPGFEFFALHFNTANNPDIYSGKLSFGLNGAASTTGDGLRANVSGLLRSGTASFTNGSLDAYSASLNLASQLALEFTLTAPVSGIYQVSLQPILSELQGRWQGIWSDGGATTGTESAPFSIDISNVGGVTLPVNSLVNSCQYIASISPQAGVNIFSVVLTIPALTGCVRTIEKPSGVILNGVAVVYKSPVAGKTSRLDLVVIDETTGSGISFRGDR